ncbi:MAG: beta-propeller domain-containing protein [Spirochaetales bacterium]
MKQALVFTAVLLLLSSCSLFLPSGNTGPVKDGALGWLTPAPYSNKLGATDLATSAQSPSSDPSLRSVADTDIYFSDTANHTLYVANLWKGLMALDVANPQAPSLAGTLALQGTPYEMVDAGTRLAVLSNPGGASTSSLVTFASKAAAGTLSATGTVTLGGSILDSRVVSHVGSGSVLFVATNEWVGSSATTGAGSSSSVSSPVAVATGMFAGPSSFQASVWAVDLGTGQKLSQFSVPGSSSAVCISETAVYVASSGAGSGSGSTLTRYGILADGTLAPNPKSVAIGGYIQDRFKLDDAAGILRVVEMVWSSDWSNRSTKVFSVDFTGATPLSHENTGLVLGTGESLFASRFDGTECYVVTFLQKDPLFCVSLADPVNPVKVGAELTVPGYSTYLQVVNTTAGKRLFAIGVDSGAGWKVKASLYDISHPSAMAQVGADVFLGDGLGSTWSGANWDWKRVNHLDGLGAFALPYASWNQQTYQATYNVAIVDYASGTLSQRCLLPNSGDVERTLASSVAGVVYTYAADRLQTWQLGSTPSLVSETVLAEDIAWAAEIGGRGLKLVNRDGKLVLQTFALEAWASAGHTSELVLPATLSSGDSLWYRLGTGGIRLENSTLYLLASSYGSWTNSANSYQATAVVVRIDLSGTPSLVGDPITLVDSTNWAPGGASSGGASFFDTSEPSGTDQAVYLFHGAVSRIGSTGAATTTATGGGFTALGSGTLIDLFTWETVAGRDGFGRVTRTKWDFASGSAVLGKQADFPGYPVLLTATGQYLSAWTSYDQTTTTHLLGVVEDSSGLRIVGTAEHSGALQATWSDPGFSALVFGSSGYYALADLEVRTVWVKPDGTLSDALFGSLSGSGWSVSLFRSGPRWAVGDSTQVLTGQVNGHSSTLDQTVALSGGNAWSSPGLWLNSAHLYVARGMTGIERH